MTVFFLLFVFGFGLVAGQMIDPPYFVKEGGLFGIKPVLRYDHRIFQNQNSSIVGVIVKADKGQVIIRNSNNLEATFPTSHDMAVVGQGQDSGNQIETGKEAFILLELRKGRYEVVSIQYRQGISNGNKTPQGQELPDSISKIELAPVVTSSGN